MTMKSICLLFFLFLPSFLLQAQNVDRPDITAPVTGNENKQLGEIKKELLPGSPRSELTKSELGYTAQDTLAKLKKAIQDTNEVKKETPKPDLQKQQIADTNVKTNVVATDSSYKKILVQDSTAHLYNMYRGLLNDDPIYNKKAPLWQPIMKVLVQNTLINLVDHYIIGYDWAVVGFNSWNKTAVHSGFPWGNGWKWDQDRFGNNFFLHPYTGAGYFNSARSGGYNYWESSIFVFFGAYTYKLFGENGWPDGKPEKNDLIATTLGGMVGGEIQYRLGSNVIDERTVGAERVGREFLAFLVSPGRTLSRFMNGKLFAHNTEEVYQKEPLDVILSAGGILVNDKNTLGTGPTGVFLNLDFDYGNPFEKRYRKPFDYFQFRADLNFGLGRKYVDQVMGYGILTGTNTKLGNIEVLAGIFQHFDYWDNKVFELGTMSFGGGVITKANIAKGTNLYVDMHVAVVPFAGNSTEKGPDTSQVRDYNFGGGAEAKGAVTLNIGGVVSASMTGYYYWIRTFVGLSGDNYIAILKPRIEVHLFSNVGIGFEHRIFFQDRYLHDYPAIHQVHTQQKLFVTYYLADFMHNK